MAGATQQVPLSAQQRSWYDTARGKINQERLTQVILDLTNIHSPTGDEREASQFMVDYLNSVGIDAHYQAVNERSGIASAASRQR